MHACSGCMLHPLQAPEDDRDGGGKRTYYVRYGPSQMCSQGAFVLLNSQTNHHARVSLRWTNVDDIYVGNM